MTLLVLALTLGFDPAPAPFRRGDANADGSVNISDVSKINDYLMNGGFPACLDAYDANGDNAVDVSDSSYLSNYLFSGGPAPPSPGPVNCGYDAEGSSDGLDCFGGHSC